MPKQFIELADVKINNSYDYYRSIAPTVAEKAPAYTNGQTWLNLTTGYSYELTDEVTGTWTQIETDLDAHILAIANNTFMRVLRYLNNHFFVDRNKNYSDDYTSPNLTRNGLFSLYSYESVYGDFEVDSGTKTIEVVDDEIYGSITESFVADDVIYISGSKRCDGFYTVATVTDSTITVDETIADDDASFYILLVSVPVELLAIIGKMIWYDIYKRPQATGMQSERIGTYSYTLQNISGIGYPIDITAGLDDYMNLTIGGICNFVN